MKLFGKTIEFFRNWFRRRKFQKKGMLSSKSRLTPEKTFSGFADRSKILGLALLVLLWCVCVGVLVVPKRSVADHIVLEDRQAAYSVYADFPFSYVDEEKTAELRVKARDAEPAIYRLDQSINEGVMREVGSFFTEIAKRVLAEKKKEKYKASSDNAASAIVAGMSRESLKLLQAFLHTPSKKEFFMEQLGDVLQKGVYSPSERQANRAARIRIIDSEGRLRDPRPYRNIQTPSEAALNVSDAVSQNFSPQNRFLVRRTLYPLFSSIIKSNLVFDAEKTSANRMQASENIAPVEVDVKEGDLIIAKGDTVSKQDRIRYECYKGKEEKLSQAADLKNKFIESSLICLLLMILTGIYIHHIHPEVMRSNQKLGITGTVLMISLLANLLAIKGFYSFEPVFSLSPRLIPAVLPLALAPVLLSVLVGLRAGLYAGLFVSLIAALQLDGSFHVVLSGMVLSCMAGFAVRHAPNHRAYYLRTALAVILTLPVMEALRLWSIRDGIADATREIMLASGLAAANGIVTAGLALALLFVLESLFQVSTDMSLLLFSDYNHPLLKRLQLEAPGTYHHSLVVSTLSEQAAHEIGASPIRARVCALFHDIGKLSKPEYFVENCGPELSKHNDLNPKMSSLIIINHVKDGVDMAIKNKLRKVIRDCIEQHHGTDLMYYFYKMAEENGDSDVSVSENDYRYPGPLPREKEVVLVSLADACEAASRSLQKPTPAKIDALVWEILRKRIRDGQLDCADITFGELAKVRKSFAKTLSTMLHGRIAYPKDEDEDEIDLFKETKKVAGAKTDGTPQNGAKNP